MPTMSGCSNKVTFGNRMIRSSIGGRTCYDKGDVNSVWRRFERRFAEPQAYNDFHVHF